ncbi:MAG: hypothetical protein LBU23_13575 [Planctomycetota bacterium]|jgi:hypothetical protein|nr:hypothetical protein [Planctomycetota bacterium]
MAREKKPPAGRRRNLPELAAVFFVAFALAFALAWLLWRPPPSGGGASDLTGRNLAASEIGPFAEAARRGDFAAMRDLGARLFLPGVGAEEAAKALAEFETNGFPPYKVYAPPSRGGAGKVFRVLLTLDAGWRVASFVAEEMDVVE